MTLFLLAVISLSFGDTRMFLSVCPPLKCTAIPCFPHMFFILSHMPCAYGITMWHLLADCFDVGVCFFFFPCCCWKICFIAHLGYLHWPSTSSGCSYSFSSNFGIEQMVCALYVRVLITLYLAAKLWLLSHRRYKSVCVGFLYTPMEKVLSVSGVIMVSKKSRRFSSNNRERRRNRPLHQNNLPKDATL